MENIMSEEKQKTAIYIEFEGDHSTLFSIQPIGRVDYYQMIIAAEYMQLMAKDGILELKRINQMQAQQEQLTKPDTKILVPKAKLQ